MKKTIKYNKVETVTYEFSVYEIKEALMEKHDIKPSYKTQFEIYEEWENKPAYAKLIVDYTSPLEDAPNKEE